MAKIDIIAQQYAEKITSKLDLIDGKDNKIKAETWTRYAVSIFGASDNVKEQISIHRAKKSIEHYIKREIKRNGGHSKDIGETWFNNLLKASEKSNIKKDSPKVNISEPQKTKVNLPNKSELVQELAKRNDELNKRMTYHNASKKEVTKEEVKQLMQNEVSRREIADVHSKNIDYNYWSEKVSNVSNQYNIQPALFVAIMAQESNGMFTKGVDKPAGRGPMGITTITVKDYFLGNNKKGLWYEAFKELDKNLLTDILYKKDKDGNLIFRFNKAEDIRDNCAKDEEYGLKVGLLAYKMNYMKEATKYFMGLNEKDKINAEHVTNFIKQLKAGTIKISERENQIIMDRAARNYNGNNDKYSHRSKYAGREVREVYREQVIDSLRNNGYNFKGDYLIECYKKA